MEGVLGLRGENYGKAAAATIVVSLCVSSAIAYGFGHIGIAKTWPQGVSGCRMRYVQDISCSGVCQPERFIFAGGLSIAWVLLGLAFREAQEPMSQWLGRRWGKSYFYMGLCGCFFGFPMAWISMAIAKGLHLAFAACMGFCFGVAAAIRSASDAAPQPRWARGTAIVALVCFSVWLSGILVLRKTGNGWSLMEWLAMCCFVVHVALMPSRTHLKNVEGGGAAALVVNAETLVL